MTANDTSATNTTNTGSPNPEPTGATSAPTTQGRRSKGPSITLAICLAAGLAAGIGLARPGIVGQPNQADAAPDAALATGYGSDQAAPDQAAPSQEAQTPAAGGTPAAQPASIQIADFAFGEPITVAPGAAITVTNVDGAPHTLTSTDGLFDTGNLAGGASATVTAPTEPGTYQFFCSIHPSMQGSFVVTS